MSAADWAALRTRHWNESPVRLTASESPDADLTYRVVVAAAEPFRAGTRFRALPDVRFFTEGGRIRAPGDLLPDADDPTADHYAKRMAGRRYLLVVEQPLPLDFRLWSQVRDLVAPLWRHVGVPTVPVVTELAVANGHVRDDGPGHGPTHSVLTWVLRGSVRVELHGDTDQTLRGEAGDVLYWPATYRYAVAYGDDCLVLSLLVPIDGRLATAQVKELLGTLLQRRRSTSEVPYMPYPPPQADDGSLPHVAPLADTATALAEVSAGTDLERILRIMWAKRVSAGGLEPVPDPRQAIDLKPEHRIRLTADIVRMSTGDGGWTWAVNGHGFSVRGSAADEVLARLRRGDAIRVAELGATPVALLRRLYALRGIDTVTEGND